MLTRALALSGSNGDSAQIPEAPESLDSPLAKVAPYFAGRVAGHQAQHEGRDEPGEDQQEPVEVAAHGHWPLKPAAPGCGALLLDAPSAHIPHTSLGTAPVRTEAATGCQFDPRIRAVHRRILPSNPRDNLGQKAAQGQQIGQHTALFATRRIA